MHRGSLRDGDDLEPGRRRGGHVLVAVHGEVDLAVAERAFDLGDERAGGPCLGRHRRMRLAVARGGDDDGLRVEPGVLAEQRDDDLGLPARKVAPARPDPQHGAHEIDSRLRRAASTTSSTSRSVWAAEMNHAS